jgi:hypothetical protein
VVSKARYRGTEVAVKILVSDEVRFFFFPWLLRSWVVLTPNQGGDDFMKEVEILSHLSHHVYALVYVDGCVVLIYTAEHCSDDRCLPGTPHARH